MLEVGIVGDGDLEDLLSLAPLAAAPLPAIHGRGFVGPPGFGDHREGHADEHADSDLEELLLVQNIGRRKRGHKNRSDGHMESMRHKKAKRQHLAEREKYVLQNKVLQESLEDLQVAVPIARSLLPVQLKRRSMDTRRAILLMKLALLHRVRQGGQGAQANGASSAQIRAASTFAHVARDIMRDRLAELFRPAVYGATEVVASASPVRRRAHMLAGTLMFDETRQYLCRLPGTGVRSKAHGKEAVQIIMMQCHVASTIANTGFDGSMSFEVGARREPWFKRAERVESTHATVILDRVVAGLPLPVMDVEKMQALSRAHAFIVIAVGCDRYAANFAALKWFWDFVANALPPSLLPVVEPCAAHGVQLVRCFSPLQRALTQTISTFPRFWRIAKNKSQILDAVRLVINDQLEVRNEPSPEAADTRAEKLLEYLYGDITRLQTDSGLDKGSAHFFESPKVSVLKEICAFFRVDDAGVVHLCHWCYVLEGSKEHLMGKTVGAKCCSSIEESRHKAFAAYESYLCHRAWTIGCDSRWTRNASVERRLIPIMPVLRPALHNLRAGFGFSDDLDKELAALLRATNGDFQGEQKHTLLSLCKAWPGPEAERAFSFHVTAHLPLERLCYWVLGRRRDKHIFLDFTRPSTSPLADLIEGLMDLMVEYSEENHKYRLLQLFRWDFSCASLRRQARRDILQLICGAADHFEMRLSHPGSLSSLAVLCDPVAEEEATRTAVEKTFAEPRLCCTLAVQRLVRHFGSQDAFLRGAPPFIAAALKEVPFAIDEVERSHTQMRQQLSSDGAGVSGTAAANRTFLQQLHTEHRRQGGEPQQVVRDDALPLQDVAAHAGDVPPPAKNARKRRGALEFWNSRRAAFKAVYAPDRPLTEDELRSISESARQAWLAIADDADLREAWKERAVQNTAVVPTPVKPEAGPLAVPPAKEPFVGVWGSSSQRTSVFNPGEVLWRWQAARKNDADPYKTAYHDPALFPRPPPKSSPPWELHGGWGESALGCTGLKKNICRCHGGHPAAFLEALSASTALLAKFTDSLGAEQVKSADTLVWLGVDKPTLEATEDDAEPKGQASIIALLVTARYSPKMQWFVQVQTLPDQQLWVHGIPTVPCEVEIACNLQRLDKTRLSIRSHTSDDICALLLKRHPDATTIRIRRLHAEIDTEIDDLLHMKVTGVESEDFKAKVPRVRTTTDGLLKAAGVLDDMENPLAQGRAAALAGMPATEPGHEDDAAGGPSELDHAEDYGEAGGCDLVGIDPLLAPGLADHLHDVFGLPGPADWPMPAADDAMDGAEVEDSFDEDEVADVEVGDVEPAAADVHATMDDLVADASIEGEGFICTARGPLAAFGAVARLSISPLELPEERRRLKVTCLMHRDCSIFTSRRLCSNDLALRWAFAGELLPEGSTPAARKEAGVRHKTLWGRLRRRELDVTDLMPAGLVAP